MHQRSPRDAFLQFLADVDAANERPTRPTFAAPAIGDVAAVHEKLEPVEGGGTVRTLQAVAFVRHNIAVFIHVWTLHVPSANEPTPTQVAEAVARHLDGVIKDSPRYESIAASGLAPIIDELRVAGVEGDLLERNTEYQVVVKTRDPAFPDIPSDHHLSLAGMAHLWSVGAWQDQETGLFRLDVGSEPPPERLLRLRVVNLRGCMSEKIVRYRVNRPPPGPPGEGSGK